MYSLQASSLASSFIPFPCFQLHDFMIWSLTWPVCVEYTLLPTLSFASISRWGLQVGWRGERTRKRKPCYCSCSVLNGIPPTAHFIISELLLSPMIHFCMFCHSQFCNFKTLQRNMPGNKKILLRRKMILSSPTRYILRQWSFQQSFCHRKTSR